MIPPLRIMMCQAQIAHATTKISLMVFQVNEVIVGRIVRPIEISIQTRQWQNCALRYMKQQAFSVMPPTMWTILIALRKRWRL